MTMPMEKTTVKKAPGPSDRAPVLMAAACSVLVGLAACESASDVDLLEIEGQGAVSGSLLLDLNGTGTVDTPDSALAGVGVVLSTPSGAPVATVDTDEEGRFAFAEVPAGRYRLGVADAFLGDSLAPVGPMEPLDVVEGDAPEATILLSFPELTIEEVRSAPPEHRVFTTGIALNSRQNFTEGRVFLAGASAFLQTTDVARERGVAVGDSVRLLGRPVIRAGQPALDVAGAVAVVLVPQAAVPVPEAVSTAEAAEAGDGALDAALVRIDGAGITDTVTVGDTLMVTADDGTGPVQLAWRPFLGTPPAALAPGTGFQIERAVGMLSPYVDGGGLTRWRLLVRSGADLTTVAEPAAPGPPASSRRR